VHTRPLVLVNRSERYEVPAATPSCSPKDNASIDEWQRSGDAAEAEADVEVPVGAGMSVMPGPSASESAQPATATSSSPPASIAAADRPGPLAAI
jgi:hypothetical protein